MAEEKIPQSAGDNLLSPISLTPKQEELCKKLDEFHASHGLKTKPSEMFRGALFASRTELRANPDWVSQAANSLREILYPFGNGAPNKTEALKAYGSVRAATPTVSEVGRLFGSFTELAHHGNSRGNSIDFDTFEHTNFEQLVADFETAMLEVMARQLDIHQEIDAILSKGSPQ